MRRPQSRSSLAAMRALTNNTRSLEPPAAASFSVQVGLHVEKAGCARSLEVLRQRKKGKHSPSSVAHAVMERHIKPVESTKQQVVSVPSPATRKVNLGVKEVCSNGQRVLSKLSGPSRRSDTQPRELLSVSARKRNKNEVISPILYEELPARVYRLRPSW